MKTSCQISSKKKKKVNAWLSKCGINIANVLKVAGKILSFEIFYNYIGHSTVIKARTNYRASIFKNISSYSAEFSSSG